MISLGFFGSHRLGYSFPHVSYQKYIPASFFVFVFAVLQEQYQRFFVVAVQ
jgi:hypothetical protein